MPAPQLLENISTLWRILELVVRDWTSVVAPIQETVDSACGESAALAAMHTGWTQLQVPYLKCLFSYVMFFTACDRAYEALYRQLNEANRRLRACRKHGRPPKRSLYIEKVRRIRDLGISHLASEKAGHLDAYAGMSWIPNALSRPIGEQWNLERITFGAFRHRHHGELEESADMEVVGILEINEHCITYLSEFDDVCADYLGGLLMK